MMSVLKKIENWFTQNCNGQWELYPNSKTPPSIRWSFHFSASVGVESPTEVSMFSFS